MMINLVAKSLWEAAPTGARFPSCSPGITHGSLHPPPCGDTARVRGLSTAPPRADKREPGLFSLSHGSLHAWSPRRFRAVGGWVCGLDSGDPRRGAREVVGSLGSALFPPRADASGFPEQILPFSRGVRKPPPSRARGAGSHGTAQHGTWYPRCWAAPRPALPKTSLPGSGWESLLPACVHLPQPSTRGHQSTHDWSHPAFKGPALG